MKTSGGRTMGERITGGQVAESLTLGQTVLAGAKRLVALTNGIDQLEKSQAQMVEVLLMRTDTDPLQEAAVPITRAQLLALLKGEREQIGQKLARLLGTLYGPE